MAESGIILCGAVITFENGALAKLLGISGLGASRRVIDMTDGDSTDLWGEFLGSCIARMKPFRVQLKFLSSYNWVPLLQGSASNLAIAWPVAGGFSTASGLAFDAFVSDVDISGELESRMTQMYEIQPTGKPVVTAGTVIP